MTIELPTLTTPDATLTPLVPALTRGLGVTHFSLIGKPRAKRFTLWCRKGAKKIFYIRLIRKAGKYLVEMGGGDPDKVLQGIQICKEYFDESLGLSPPATGG